MRGLLLTLIACLFLFAACGGGEAPDEEPTTAEAAATDGDPEPVPADQSMIALGSATDLIVVGEDQDDMLASLTLGTGTTSPAEPPTAAYTRPVERDAGLGAVGGRTISMEQIQTTITRNMGQVKACYERQLKSKPGMKGKVVASWTIGADGKVRSAKVIRNTTGDRELGGCVRSLVAAWRFPTAQSPQDVEYPFKFKPEF